MRNEGALHFALSALVLWAVRDVTGSGLSCLRSGPSEGGQTRVTFLREDSAGVRSLYLTRWSEDLRLVTCEVNTSPAVVESYVSECDGLDTQSPEIPQRFMNLSMQLDPDDPCALSSSAPKFARRTRRDGGQGTRRSKRSWIFPGTLWCGSGSRAGGYEQLGMFEGADRCCREHDHCLHVIPALTVHYGVFNPNFFTVSHCDCDQRFRDCLLGVNDTISRMVGYSFFNILQIPCFELTQLKRCTEMYWWGMCKAAGEAPYAVFRRPLSYNTSHVSGKHEDATSINKSDSSDTQPVTQSPVTSKHRTSPRGDHGSTIDRLLVNVTPARTQTTLPPSQHSLTRPWTTAAPAKATTFKDGRQQEKKDSRLLWNEVNQELLQENRLQSPHWERGSRENKTLHNLADSRLLCRSLKHLDECRYKIPPLKRKYELQNTENKTAYHCDCTSR
ncbi:group 3 secretory phospholipase A2-like [Aulostomus maculatus]